jgi:hypothetical protein
LAAAARHSALLIFILIAGLPGFILPLLATWPRLPALLPLAALRASERFLARFKLAAHRELFLVAVNLDLNFFTRLHIANPGDEALNRLNLLAIDFGDAVAFLDAHLIGGRIGEHANDSDALAAAVLLNVHAEAGVFLIAALRLALAVLLIILTAVLLRVVATILLVLLRLILPAAELTATRLREPR